MLMGVFSVTLSASGQAVGNAANFSASRLDVSGAAASPAGLGLPARSGQLGCTTQPAAVYPGQVVIARAAVGTLQPGRHPHFHWTASGGHILPSDSSARIDTNGLSPGDYTVVAHMSYAREAAERAICTAPFTVRAFEPPTITCSASPPSVISGDTVTIHAVGVSPQDRPLTYSYTASAGELVHSGPTARLSTSGVAASSLSVTCSLIDDQGKSATTTTTVSVTSLPVPVVAQARPLCTLSFKRDKWRPVRVDNEAKGCLDDVALALNQQADAQLFIIGNQSREERPGAGAERSLNIRQYLTRERGIDVSRIYVRSGDSSGRTARTVLVPAGAAFDDTHTQVFDEGAVRRHGQAYGTHGTATLKHAALQKRPGKPGYTATHKRSANPRDAAAPRRRAFPTRSSRKAVAWRTPPDSAAHKR